MAKGRRTRNPQARRQGTVSSSRLPDQCFWRKCSFAMFGHMSHMKEHWLWLWRQTKEAKTKGNRSKKTGLALNLVPQNLSCKKKCVPCGRQYCAILVLKKPFFEDNQRIPKIHIAFSQTYIAVLIKVHCSIAKRCNEKHQKCNALLPNMDYSLGKVQCSFVKVQCSVGKTVILVLAQPGIPGLNLYMQTIGSHPKSNPHPKGMIYTRWNLTKHGAIIEAGDTIFPNHIILVC